MRVTDGAKSMTPELPDCPPDLPVLIAGATAAGKSALALAIAESQGREVVNADALQVFDAWPVLTARPGPDDLSRAPHRLYGHVPAQSGYSVGQWLRDLEPHLKRTPAPIIVGGTGLYFMALTEGLADIPAIDPDVRAEADARIARHGSAVLLLDLDPATRARIDTRNPARVQRAWEVQQQTGRGLADWQTETGPAKLPLDACIPIHVSASPHWLAERIDRRFDQMIANGALQEASVMAATWDPGLQSSRAIGAAELIAVALGTLPLDAAVSQAKQATRRYAKRQRTWFRRRMGNWRTVAAEGLAIRQSSR